MKRLKVVRKGFWGKKKMISLKAYKEFPERFWKGKKVVCLRRIENGWVVIPEGFEMEIDRKYKGFSIKGVDFCEHCNIGKKLSMSRVKPQDLRLIEKEKWFREYREKKKKMLKELMNDE